MRDPLSVRNAPLPNAVNLFNCAICDKGYPRQTDYENHLRSYDHNHRQRLAEMKKLTAANEGDSARSSKGPLDMRSISLGDTGKKQGLGSRFKKIGGAPAAAATAGGRFKKVGVAVGETKEGEGEKTKKSEVKEASLKSDIVPLDKEPSVAVTDTEGETQVESKQDDDVVMIDCNEDEAITWEEYDFTKPSGCDHTNCPGCVAPEGLVYEDGWLVLSSA
ncbi:hypothetical protein N0V90_000821 [Kalmusia sp. IMI 367209]|nr:hypothetical protein N0V90_000821 [Kalmusia sp. IMI 367209]